MTRCAVVVVLDGMRRDMIDQAHTPRLVRFAERAQTFLHSLEAERRRLPCGSGRDAAPVVDHAKDDAAVGFLQHARR